MSQYGCHNRAPFRESMPVQAGWYTDGYTRTPRMQPSPFRMSRNCEYSKDKDDVQCDGCKWKAKNA